MSYEEIDGEWQHVRMLFEEAGDEFGQMTLAEALSWLQSIGANQPCPPEEIFFKIRQSGDQWDGYSMAEIMIYRAETDEERAQREMQWAEDACAREAQTREKERAVYEALRAKFESSP